jgi:hypothetical protein
VEVRFKDRTSRGCPGHRVHDLDRRLPDQFRRGNVRYERMDINVSLIRSLARSGRPISRANAVAS